MGSPANKKYQIGDPKLQVADIVNGSTKYKIGEPGFSFGDIKSLKPTFAFDYLSLNGKDFCFNNNSLTKADYIGLLEGLHKISDTPYEILHDTRAYRFHKIDFSDKRVTIKKSDFKKILTKKPATLKEEELPNLWQFDLQYVQQARACGFLYKGVFYLVWYDRHHKIYPRE